MNNSSDSNARIAQTAQRLRETYEALQVNLEPFQERHARAIWAAISELNDLVRSAPQAAQTEDTDAEDAAKWRAFRNCARVRIFGGAGFQKRDDSQDDDYRYLTLEVWTKHPAKSEPKALEILEEFVATAQRCQRESKSVEQAQS